MSYHPLPTGAHMSTIKDGDSVDRGDILARLPFEASKSSDIVSGLPRVTELFEARKPRDAAFIATIDGKIHLQGISRGMRVLKIINSETGLESETYRIPVGKHLHFQEGEEVRSGEQLTDGPINPHDILAVQGEEAVQHYLVSEVQKVYRAQGERINDKHIETVIRQMLGKVEIGEPGDTEFLGEEEIDRTIFHAMNHKTREEGGESASAKVILQGITKAALSTESFVSAASFQQTTSVLTKASAIGKKDYLRGLKENVIMGHLIPAGTGLPRFRSVEVAEKGKARMDKVEKMLAGTLDSVPSAGDSKQMPAD
jgi:DNA-directed RNA polymerase subunit beta'